MGWQFDFYLKASLALTASLLGATITHPQLDRPNFSSPNTTTCTRIIVIRSFFTAVFQPGKKSQEIVILRKKPMFGKKSTPIIKSLIAEKCKIEGNLNFSDGLRVDGLLIGKVTSSPDQNGLIFISESGEVRGAISAQRIIINGKVIGPIFAHEKLEIEPKANITGDIYYKIIEMHPGSVIDGCMKQINGAEATSKLKDGKLPDKRDSVEIEFNERSQGNSDREDA